MDLHGSSIIIFQMHSSICSIMQAAYYYSSIEVSLNKQFFMSVHTYVLKTKM